MAITSVTVEPGDTISITFGGGVATSGTTSTISGTMSASGTMSVGIPTGSSGGTVVSGGSTSAVTSSATSGAQTGSGTVVSSGGATVTPASAPGTIVNGTVGSISDGVEVYAINSAGQITINGAVVPSSANVVQLYWSGAEPVYQLNSLGAWWTQPADGAAGVAVSGTPPGYPVAASGTTASGATVPTKPGKTAIGANSVYPAGAFGNNGQSMLFKPANAGAQTFRIAASNGDWKALFGTLSPEGQGGGLCSKIPCPGGHLDWEYGNPEAEYYLDPSEGNYPNPHSINGLGEWVITCSQHATPNSNQGWLSGALTTAGNQGVFFAQSYGTFSAQVVFNGFGPGFWPAVWMLSDDPGNNGGTNADFNYSIELDAEWWQNLPEVHLGLANAGDGGVFVPGGNPLNGVPITITFDYRESGITWYVNGVNSHSIVPPASDLALHLFFIFNIAVGTNGSWAGSPPVVAGSSMTMTIVEMAAWA